MFLEKAFKIHPAQNVVFKWTQLEWLFHSRQNKCFWKCLLVILKTFAFEAFKENENLFAHKTTSFHVGFRIQGYFR